MTVFNSIVKDESLLSAILYLYRLIFNSVIKIYYKPQTPNLIQFFSVVMDMKHVNKWTSDSHYLPIMDSLYELCAMSTQ
jgi:hypothetical protein